MSEQYSQTYKNSPDQEQRDLSPKSRGEDSANNSIHGEPAERAPRSWIFLNKYARREIINGNKFIVCQVSGCRKSYSSKGSTTTNLARHLKIVHGLSKGSENNYLSQPVKEVSPKIPMIKPEITLQYSEELNEKLLDFILSTKLPISIVEDQSFQNLAFAIQSVAPNTLHFPSSDSMMNSILSRYQALKPAVYNLLQQQPSISLAVNVWTSPCRQDFMEITAHFIDKSWSQKEVSLGLELLQDPPSGNAYARQLLRVIDDYGISRKIFTITTDTQPNCLAMVQELEFLSATRADFEFTRAANHLPCVGSIVNYAANSALAGMEIPTSCEGSEEDSRGENSELNAGSQILNKLRVGLGKIKNSTLLLAKYEEYCRSSFQISPTIEFNLAADWRSTFSMISMLRKTHRIYNVICEQVEELHPYRIEHEDLEYLEILIKLLEFFEQLTAALSTSRFPSVSRTIPNFDMLLFQIKTIQTLALSPALVAIANSCSDKLERYMESAYSPAFLVATAVDPRLKYEYWEDAGWDRQTQDKAHHVVSTVWNSQFRMGNSQPSEMEHERNNRPRTTLKKSRQADELARYTSELAVEDGFEDGKCALEYWKVWANTYPNLSEMARWYLALPATCAPTQCLFSKSGMAPLAVPSGMEPEVMKQVALLSSWKALDL